MATNSTGGALAIGALLLLYMIGDESEAQAAPKPPTPPVPPGRGGGSGSGSRKKPATQQTLPGSDPATTTTPQERAAIEAGVRHALAEQGFHVDLTPSSRAQQDALRRDGTALPEVLSPRPNPPPGAPVVPQPPAANDNAAPVQKPLESSVRTPRQAAEALAAFLRETKRFGSASDRPEETRQAQRDLGIKPDGIVGPITRKTAALWNVQLPAAPKTRKA